MPISFGQWKANINGLETALKLSSPDDTGVLGGELLNAPVHGWWDEASQALTFSITVVFDNGRPIVAVFDGLLFRTPSDAEAGRDVTATVAGTFHLTPGELGLAAGFPAHSSARRNRFGWYATMVEVV